MHVPITEICCRIRNTPCAELTLKALSVIAMHRFDLSLVSSVKMNVIETWETSIIALAARCLHVRSTEESGVRLAHIPH